MTVAPPAQPATGSSFRAVFPSGRSDNRHATVQFAQINDPVIGQALLDFETAFPHARSGIIVIQTVPETAGERLAEGESSLVGTIEHLAEVLGLPVKDVLAGAGISKRTYHHWKANPGTKPRLDSQGEVWALAQTVEILQERFGPKLAEWIAAQPHRRNLLRRGDHDTLVQLATTPLDLDEELVRRENARSAGFGDSDESGARPASSLTERGAPTQARTASRGRGPVAR